MKASCITVGKSAAAALLLALAACGPKFAQGLTAGETGRVTRVADDGGLALSGGLIARLSGVELPDAALAPDLALRARKALADAAVGRSVRLYYDGRKRDGRGAALAQIYAKTEAGDWIWLQENLLREGLARVRTTPSERLASRSLLKTERAARKAQKGLWTDPDFAVRRTDSAKLTAYAGRFVLAEGVIANAAKRGGRIYLNFGADYRTDFTASIPEEAWSAWPGGGADALDLLGASVRVRGVLEMRNGPSIEVTHPEQIELLAAQP